MLLRFNLLMLCVLSVTAQEEADVLILGAGMAGQSAAAYFMKKNVSFLLIEGASQTGGRMRSVDFAGKMVELGSAGIYAKDSEIQEMVDMYNITGMYADFESVIVRTPNNEQPDVEADASWDKLIEAQENVKAIYKDIKDMKTRDMSARIALDLSGWYPKTPIDDVIEVYDYDYEWSKIPEESSIYGFESAAALLEKPFFSNDTRGLQKIFEKISEEDPMLKLNEVVTNVTATDSSVTVTTKSGKKYTGKYAIVTFSIGVLKSGNVMFEPALPEWKRDTIFRTSMDPYAQIYVSFPAGTAPYWGNNQFVLYASPRRGYYPVLWNLEAETFSPTGKPMISFHVFGEEAKRVQRENKTTVKAEITDVLMKMFGSGSTEPEDILVTDWLMNPLTMGSFTSRQVGDNYPQFLDALMSRVGRIHFAGDAYNNIADGFLIGALDSGNNVAEMVHNCMMGKKCHSYNPDDYKPKPQPPPPTCGTSVSFGSLLLLLTCLTTLMI